MVSNKRYKRVLSELREERHERRKLQGNCDAWQKYCANLNERITCLHATIKRNKKSPRARITRTQKRGNYVK